MWIFGFMLCTLTLPLFSAQNNFQVMARHSDWPKKFLLGQVSFLTDQKWKKKPSNPFSVIWTWLYFFKKAKSKIYWWRFGSLFKNSQLRHLVEVGARDVQGLPLLAQPTPRQSHAPHGWQTCTLQPWAPTPTEPGTCHTDLSVEK